MQVKHQCPTTGLPTVPSTWPNTGRSNCVSLSPRSSSIRSPIIGSIPAFPAYVCITAIINHYLTPYDCPGVTNRCTKYTQTRAMVYLPKPLHMRHRHMHLENNIAQSKLNWECLLPVSVHTFVHTGYATMALKQHLVRETLHTDPVTFARHIWVTNFDERGVLRLILNMQSPVKQSLTPRNNQARHTHPCGRGRRQPVA